jgi:hypothetical protein
MTRRALLNVGLLALVAGLLLMVYFEPGVKHEPEHPHLTGLSPNDVQRIRIRQSGGAELSLSRKNGVWMLDAPVATYANEFRIEPLLRVTEAESYASFAAQGQDLKQYQLEPPLAVLRLNDLELEFGGTEPINNRRYVRVDGTVHLIDDHYYFRLQAGFPAFVSNRLLPPDAQPVRVALPDFTLSRDAQGRWSANPALKGVAADALNSFVDEWKGAQAVEVDRYEDGGTGKKARIEFAAGAAPIDFQVSESGSEVLFGRRDLGLRYHLTTDQARRLLSPPEPEAKPTAAQLPTKDKAAP